MLISPTAIKKLVHSISPKTRVSRAFLIALDDKVTKHIEASLRVGGPNKITLKDLW